MRDKAYREDGRPEDLLVELGYETQDIVYKKFAKYIGAFFGFFAFCIICGFGIMYLMVPTKLHGGRMSDYIPKITAPTSTPLLQSNITARTDIMSLRRNESAILDSAAVVDQKHGVYRIPIDQAIDAVVKKSDAEKAAMGLPTTKETSAPAGDTDAAIRDGQPSSAFNPTLQPGNEPRTTQTSVTPGSDFAAGVKPTANSQSTASDQTAFDQLAPSDNTAHVTQRPSGFAMTKAEQAYEQKAAKRNLHSGNRPSNRGESATTTPTTGGNGGQ